MHQGRLPGGGAIWDEAAWVISLKAKHTLRAQSVQGERLEVGDGLVQ